MKFLKLPPRQSAGAFLFILLLSGVAFLFISPESDTASAGAANAKIDKLLVDLGIFKPQNFKGPVEASFQDVHGNRIRLSDYRGKVVFLNFWATWCPPCLAEMPAMDRLHRMLKTEDFAMVAVSVKEPARQVRTFYRDKNYSFPPYLDPNGSAMRQFAIRSIPTTFILNREGHVIGAALGPREWDSRKAVALFRKLMQQTG